MPSPHFLHHAFPPENFKPEELQKIMEAFEQVSYQKHDFLQRAGQIAGHYFFIESGYARAYVIDPSGQEISTNFFTQGDILIDWQSFMLRQPGQEQIQALTDLVTWRIDFIRFNQLFQNIRAYRSHPFLFHRGARDKTFSCIPQSNEPSSLRAPPTLKHQNPHFSFFFSFPRAYMLPAIMLIYTYFILNNNNSNKSNCGRQKGEGWATGKDDQVQSQNQNFIIVKGEHTIVHLLLLFCLRSYTECASTL